VVEFIESNRFVTALCLEFKNDKPRLLTQFGRETVLQPRRIIDTSGPLLSLNRTRDENLARLRDLSARREALAREVDLAELWSLLSEEDLTAPLDPEFLAGLIYDEPLDPDQVAALVRAILMDKVYFRYQPEGLLVTPPAKVEQLMAQRRREEELVREKRSAGEWLAAVWTGREAEPPKEAEEIIASLIDVALFGQDSTHSPRVKGFLEEAGIRGQQAPFKLLVKLGRFDKDEDLDLRRLNLPVTFPRPVLDQAHSLAVTGLAGFSWDHREDLTGLDVFTIDGAATRDFDDALSFSAEGERLFVQVHITDVSAFIEPDSLLDLEARARASSAYLPDRRLPMLPEELSEGLLSLQEGQLRPALTLSAELDRTGRVKSHRLINSTIKVSQRLTYREVDQSLESDPRLSCLARLAVKLKELRAENGAISLEVPEVMVWPGPERVEIERLETVSPSRLLVAEMMILANRLAAETLAEAGFPAPFRCQEPLKADFEPPPGADELWVTLRKRMLFSPLEISPVCAPHCGLGLAAYTTFTSPIRRYYDLITLRQLQAWLKGRKPVYDQASLEEMSMLLGPILRSHNQLKFRRQRYWLLKYLAQEPERELEALVLRQLKDRYSLVLLETMLRVNSPKLDEGALQEGQRIKVKATRIDPLDDMLRIELI